MEKSCEICGATLEEERFHYCPACRQKRNAERREINNAKQKERWLQKDQTCEMCGGTFKAGRKRQRCDDCNFKARQEQMKRNLETREARRREKVRNQKPREDRAWRREDGVLVLPPALGPEKVRKIRKPGPKADPKSLEVILYQLETENVKRVRQGMKTLSYGQFVALQQMKNRK